MTVLSRVNKIKTIKTKKYKTAQEIGSQNLSKLIIKEYIDLIKYDYETNCGITKTKQLNEFAKIAYSSIAHLHNTWIELKEFEALTDEQKEAIESIDTKTEIKKLGDNSTIEVQYIKIKLYSKLQALEHINKMLGYNEAEKLNVDLNNKITGIAFDE